MNDPVDAYITSLIRGRMPLFEEMETYAHEQHIPIMELAGIEGLCQLLRLQQPKKILEIGTAIGYSALRMAAALPDAEIITVEREEARFTKAYDYLAQTPLSAQIRLLTGDALDESTFKRIRSYAPFDAIFIDAAKGQYQKFFSTFSPLLGEHGCIYTDNVLFKGLVTETFIEKKQVRNLVRKIRNYNEWLMQHEQFITTIFPVGDGLAVSLKR
ncbi:O-methyltransferase [Heyndrickxia acidiproducens]|uniref:O-methyltransferase n=1 Tax=Heyndrickxia acidiproducens TaxID=1121084 RepID=UPI000367E7CD|nr:O-methyltransferase [Heyndrickxia acidiproducens]